MRVKRGICQKPVDIVIKDRREGMTWKQLWHDLIISGHFYTMIGYRKWYNPMRYITGKTYIKRIDPKKVYKG